MVTIKPGDSFTVSDCRSGETERGPWWFFKVKAEKGKDSITVWSDEPVSFRDGDTVRVEQITQVKKGNRKFQEKWFDTFDITAKLALVGNAAKPMAVDVDASDELPF